MENANTQETVERSVHEAFADFVQRVHDEHGLCIKSAFVDWLDVSCAADSRSAVVKEVAISMSSVPMVAESRNMNRPPPPPDTGGIRREGL